MEYFFSKPLSDLRIIGLSKAGLLQAELGLETYEDLLKYYPFRYEDRSKQSTIAALTPSLEGVRLQGYIRYFDTKVKGKKKLVARFEDETGFLDLIWFQNISWIVKKIKTNILYNVWGKPFFLANGEKQLVHPIITLALSKESYNQIGQLCVPLYHSTEKLKKQQLDTKGIAALQKVLLRMFMQLDNVETLPPHLLTEYRLISLKEALKQIHLPVDLQMLKQAQRRLKFEELFFLQLKLLKLKRNRIEKQKSKPFNDLTLFQHFYKNHLPFNLTNSQKEVLRDVYNDLKSGNQMNRLLQGDVGSGKTIVAFLAMLMVIGNDCQVAIMAPTEILAKQHFNRLELFARQLNLSIALLTGSTKKKEREHILYRAKTGILTILVGTHALLSDDVSFKELGFFVVDEQHRFGVVQRAALLTKNEMYAAHMLIMTATPIPRTLAMTFYGDLDLSMICELPIGRKPIKTEHYYESSRLKVFQFLREQLKLGKQIYIVYPLIEASATLDYNYLLAGYESITRAFPDISVGILHGKMDSVSKDIEMRRFEKNETAILVATTVIEVGIHVPNATVMVIESAERFGLAQLHQLRGRVGRGNAQSYCILMTDYRLNNVGRAKIETMVKTDNGFEIADLDLKLRGPGDLIGLQQSGMLRLKIADLTKDGNILEAARLSAKNLLQEDPNLDQPTNLLVYREYVRLTVKSAAWGMIG